MTKYESTIKTIYAPVDRVYAKLSDLTNLAVIRERANDPNFVQMIRTQAGGKVSDEQLQQLVSKLQQMEFTTDSVTVPVEQLGTSLTLQIVEREAPKLVKFGLMGAPIQANLWIQLLPCSEGTRLKVTLGVDLNFFMRQMVGSKLKDAPEKVADMLCMLPY